ncbi:group 1 truncated hemoglobin [uncultured Aquincola sp.]|uniref:group I truncated hemoglobin n=1 Tax=uncultured Aquincola sp. TaxID=886556 RepID=UPI0032B2838E
MNAANAMTLTFHRGALALALLLSLAAATPAAHAQPAPTAEPLVPVFAPDPALLADFGGVEGVRKLSALFVDNMKADPRIAHYFEKTKLPELKKQLADHLCQVLAGPCVYEGDTMKASHADLKISKADSLAQVEVLQATMDSLGIPFGSQNRLLARLAPMYRQIITR